MKYLRWLTPVCLLVCAICSFARGQTWEFLGHTEIGRDQNHESIQIVRRDQLFRNIQLRITGDAIFFDRLVFHFANGTSEEFVVSGRISSEEKNRVFDLSKETALDSVEFWYFKESWKHTPRVSLYGIRLPDNDDESIMSRH
jgi:hypothetical protein